jgi:hypothetical protein
MFPWLRLYIRGSSLTDVKTVIVFLIDLQNSATNLDVDRSPLEGSEPKFVKPWVNRTVLTMVCLDFLSRTSNVTRP